jgi:hypothetical protein
VADPTAEEPGSRRVVGVPATGSAAADRVAVMGRASELGPGGSVRRTGESHRVNEPAPATGPAEKPRSPMAPNPVGAI